MDIKEQITKVVDRITKDTAFQEQFKKEPVKAVEALLGVDLPDGAVEKVVDGVKAKLTGDKLSGAAGAIAGLFGKKDLP